MFGLLPADLYLTIAPIAALSLALAGVAVSYVILLIKLNKSEKDKIFLQSRIRDHATDILNESHQKSLRIIQDATEKARLIIKDTQVFNDDVKLKFTSDIQGIKKQHEEILNMRSEEISKLYNKFETDVMQDSQEQFKIIAKTLENSAIAGIGEFREALENERIFIHKQLESRLDEEYKKAQKDIENYKVEHMKRIDKQVFEILHTLVREILGKSLALKDHEELVQKALLQMQVEMRKSN